MIVGKLLAIDHGGVIAELGLEACQMVSPGLVCYRLEVWIHSTMPCLASMICPSAYLMPRIRIPPKTTDLLKTTEAERLVVQRVGQDIFERLLATGRDVVHHGNFG